MQWIIWILYIDPYINIYGDGYSVQSMRIYVIISIFKWWKIIRIIIRNMVYRVGGVKEVCISVQSRRSIEERLRFNSIYSSLDCSTELIINHSFQQSTVASWRLCIAYGFYVKSWRNGKDTFSLNKLFLWNLVIMSIS
jgi:hypothetical protein